MFLQPIYFPIAELGRQRGNTSLDVWVASPTYKVADRPQELKYLDVSATYDRPGKRLFVNVLNRSGQGHHGVDREQLGWALGRTRPSGR